MSKVTLLFLSLFVSSFAHADNIIGTIQKDDLAGYFIYTPGGVESDSVRTFLIAPSKDVLKKVIDNVGKKMNLDAVVSGSSLVVYDVLGPATSNNN